MAKIVRVPGDAKVRLKQAIDELKDRRTRVGWFESAKYPTGTPVAYVATIQEFGSTAQGIPPRPFMRPTVEARRNAWRALAARGAKAVLLGQMSAVNAMGLLGDMAKGDIQKAIKAVTAPPLSPITLVLRQWRKGGVPIGGKSVALAAHLIDEGVVNPFAFTMSGAKPLVETGHMLGTLTTVTE